MSQERQVTVRVQKVKRNRIRVKLVLFAALAATLLLITIFAKYICPYGRSVIIGSDVTQ